MPRDYDSVRVHVVSDSGFDSPKHSRPHFTVRISIADTVLVSFASIGSPDARWHGLSRRRAVPWRKAPRLEAFLSKVAKSKVVTESFLNRTGFYCGITPG